MQRMNRARLAPMDTGAFVLCFSYGRPFLRVVDVDAQAVVSIPTNLDRLKYGLEDVVRRAGFLAFVPNVSTALMPDDFAGDALVISDAGWASPAVATDRVWITSYRRRTEAREVDRNGDVVRTITVPDGWMLTGELRESFVLNQAGQLALWRQGYAPHRFDDESALVAVDPPDRVLLASPDGVRVYDGEGAVQRHVEFAMELGAWKLPWGGLSHDGRHLAIDTRSAPMGDAPEGNRLRYCDLELGTSVSVTGTFRGFCNRPVFSRSGRHVFVGVPREHRMLTFAVDSCSLSDMTPPGRHPYLMPLLDLGGLPTAIARPSTGSTADM